MLAIGVCVVLWLTADYYVRDYGGSWGNVASIVIVTAALCAIGILLVSATIRARVRVFLTKVFFQYEYDYRKEWLRFIGTLSESGLEHVPTTSVRAVAQIVNSPGGVVWVQEEDGAAHLPIGSWRYDIADEVPIDRSSALIHFLEDRQ